MNPRREINQLLATPIVKWVLVLDLETTCGEDLRDRPDLTAEERELRFQAEGPDREITEIGAVLSPKNWSGVFMRFSTLVRPQVPRVTPFSLELCPHINLDAMKAAMSFPMVWNQLMAKIDSTLKEEGETLENVAFLQWGGFDWKQLKQEWARNNMPPSAFAGKVDVKKWFKKKYGPLARGTKVRSGVEAALLRLRMKFTGSPHIAYNDAHNTWRVYQALRVQGDI